MMPPAFSTWKALDATAVTSLPDSPGVFEIANLVRTTLFIGAAPQSLATTLTSHLESPGVLHARAGRLYFRYAPADDAAHMQTELLAHYGERHGGTLPPAQSTPAFEPRPQRHLKAG